MSPRSLPPWMISIHALLAESDLSKTLSRQSRSRFLSTLSLRRATIVPIGVCITASISIHALLAESDGCEQYYIHAPGISIHALLAESDRLGLLGWLRTLISIHALLAESDYDTSSLMQCQAKFLSTLSLRRATHYDNYNLHCVEISIHALLAESDRYWPCVHVVGCPISIHALLAESDVTSVARVATTVEFLSTLSLRRATACMTHTQRFCVYFYPRSPCGERRYWPCVHVVGCPISIHALLAESDR